MGDKYKEKHKALGLCLNCPQPARYNRLLCGECAAKQLIVDKRNAPKIRARRIEERKCVRCGAPLLETENLTCNNCAGNNKGSMVYAKNF